MQSELAWMSAIEHSLEGLTPLPWSREGTGMKLTSVNTGLPRDVIWHGRHVMTGIFKQPVEGRIALTTLNLHGDRQADLSVHGGPHKAVYCYPIEHYDYWRSEWPGEELPLGMFGENFTTSGLSEDSVHIGDRFAVGSAEVVVTQPRLPCYKLGVRFDSDLMVKRFLASGRSGFYLAVRREGQVGAGDDISRAPTPTVRRSAEFPLAAHGSPRFCE